MNAMDLAGHGRGAAKTFIATVCGKSLDEGRILSCREVKGYVNTSSLPDYTLIIFSVPEGLD
jgi:hypothetical protein